MKITVKVVNDTYPLWWVSVCDHAACYHSDWQSTSQPYTATVDWPAGTTVSIAVWGNPYGPVTKLGEKEFAYGSVKDGGVVTFDCATGQFSVSGGGISTGVLVGGIILLVGIGAVIVSAIKRR